MLRKDRQSEPAAKSASGDQEEQAQQHSDAFAAEEPFNPQTAMILWRMRTPLIILICVYAIAILGLVLIPGVDDQGRPWHMSFFHAFYLVSYTATTIGFGEIPYPLTDAQRMWVLITIYMTVVAWFYAIGSILALVQDPVYQQARKQSRFKKEVSRLNESFYLVCGLGETGYEIVRALSNEHYRAIVIEKNADSLLDHNVHYLPEYVPVLIADASIPKYLKMAGIAKDNCKGVIAATASDEINLKVAISSKLLHPHIMVVCRSDIQSYEENMRSFDTDFVVNPFHTFATIFSMLLHSPSMHMIFNWLTGAPDSQLNQDEEPLRLAHGSWILCGYGRFGKMLYRKMLKHGIETAILEADESICEQFRNDFPEHADKVITGSGVDAATLGRAGITGAVGIIAGTNDDSNNLSIIMTARQLNPDIFVVARQNMHDNTELFERSEADLVMQPREIIARIIRAQLLNALLIPFLLKASKQDEQWINVVVSRMIAVIGDRKPYVWTSIIDEENAPALIRALQLGRKVCLRCLATDPAARNHQLECVALLHERNGRKTLMPDDEIELQPGDKILFCGKREARNAMQWSMQVMSSLNYVMTYESEPESYIWRKFGRRYRGEERRRQPRQ
ncbi:MAG TPA: potassium channel protein [Gammaproteobacteria bacterium]|nr:potassium channel protein [Gammaproteobacteria bacterium]